jgi:hypothetical protein
VREVEVRRELDREAERGEKDEVGVSVQGTVSRERQGVSYDQEGERVSRALLTHSSVNDETVQFIDPQRQR